MLSSELLPWMEKMREVSHTCKQHTAVHYFFVFWILKYRFHLVGRLTTLLASILHLLSSSSLVPQPTSQVRWGRYHQVTIIK